MIFIDAKRVKLWRFKLKNSEIPIDLSVNNEIGPAATELIKTYAESEPRFRQLFMMLKDWAEKVKILDASKGCLSSYALACLVISFLQHKSILPVLQKKGVDKNIIVSDLNIKKGKVKSHNPIKLKLNIGFVKDPSEIKILQEALMEKREKNQSMAKLIAEFFYYFLYVFNENQNEVSIKCEEGFQQKPSA